MTDLSVLEAVCYLCTLLLISYIDYQGRKIPNKLLILLVFFRMVFLTSLFFISGDAVRVPLLSSLIALLLTSAVTALLLPFLRRKTAAGDFKLLLACGFCFGLDRYLQVLLAAFVLLAVLFVIQHIQNQKNSIPFAPFICAGMLIAFTLSFL